MGITISNRRIGQHRGAPRLYLDSLALTRAGFTPGAAISLTADPVIDGIRVRLVTTGQRTVSVKRRGIHEVPVIDINSATDLEPVADLDEVQVVYLVGEIQILALASRRLAARRAARLRQRLASKAPLRSASIAFGAGITSWALHAGLESQGHACELVLANEMSDVMSEIAMASNPLVDERTTVINQAMQEAVLDPWASARHRGGVDILEAGIPCSGASRAGAAKRRLTRMEDHPEVGHLVVAVIQWIAALQPAIFIAENVPTYQGSASASILRAWLRDAGYAVQEAVLDAADYGSLESRVRWFIVAYPPGMPVALDCIDRTGPSTLTLADVLEPIAPDDPRFREVGYLVDKAARDEAAGKGFAMQFVDPGSAHVPTLRKGYHKGGSTDPRLRHPSDPKLSRLLTAVEHARIKGIDPLLIEDLPQTIAHQVCGQAVDVRPVSAIGAHLGKALRAFERAGGRGPREASAVRESRKVIAA
jgi:DNA (cytosine-5)-methyltransferase 1